MKIIPIKEIIINQAFKKEDDIKKQLDTLSAKSKSEHFWAHNYTREFRITDSNVKKIGDIWQCDFLVNGRELQEAYSIWRDYPNYYGSGDGKSMDEVLELSETEKILYSCDEYRIVLLRDEILSRTDSYWGYRIQLPVYALINNETEEIIIREEKKWRFKKILMDDLKEQESKSFVDKLKKHSPFKLFFVRSDDIECMEKTQKMLDMSLDTPTHRFIDYINKKNVWVCYALGYNSRRFDKDCTWWFVKQNTKPTYEEAVLELCHIINYYNQDSYVDFLINLREEFNVDMNKIDFDKNEFLWTQVKNKLTPNSLNVFNIQNVDILNEYINIM